jgi:hypothetical protein
MAGHSDVPVCSNLVAIIVECPNTSGINYFGGSASIGVYKAQFHEGGAKASCMFCAVFKKMQMD